jgi:hypothetical protein
MIATRADRLLLLDIGDSPQICVRFSAVHDSAYNAASARAAALAATADQAEKSIFNIVSGKNRPYV